MFTTGMELEQVTTINKETYSITDNKIEKIFLMCEMCNEMFVKFIIITFTDVNEKELVIPIENILSFKPLQSCV